MKTPFIKIIICFLITLTAAFGQEDFIKHTVVKGETVFKISGIYKVTIADIYKLNPDKEAGISENDVILIPKKGKIIAPTITTSNNAKTHTVVAKETLYSIARDFNIAFADLKQLNEAELIEGLKIGQVIKIPQKSGSSPKQIIADATKVKVEKPYETVVNTTFHIVEPKETLFGISKQYGMKIDELEKLNPGVINGLAIGNKLIVIKNRDVLETSKLSLDDKSNTINQEIKVEKPKPVVVDYEIKSVETPKTSPLSTTIKKKGFANYEVKAGETLYGLSQTLGITQDELISLNPSLKDGVREGMILVVPGKGSITVFGNSKYKNLTKTINTQNRKKLALLFPFNAAKIQNDSIIKLGSRLKKDSFLNMTLDFYSGAMMAIEYGKSLGLNIDIKILDTEETKQSSNIENLVKNNNLEDMDAIVGPFYQQYAEKVASLVAAKNVAVISPLSKEIGKEYPNLFQAMPPADYGKSAIFNFMLSKKGNIIVVSDVKRQANKDFIIKNYPTVLFAGMTANGSLDIENFKALFQADQMNYIVLDTEKTGMILSTTNLMLNDMKNYEIQLAIIEPNETLNFEEISMKRLTVLKLLYPSLSRDSHSQESILFEADYKKKNKVLPNQFATRGFDVTFDTLLRLSQGKTFMESIIEDKTEQLESKFEYSKKDSESYSNRGIYILEYQEDLTVKPVN